MSNHGPIQLNPDHCARGHATVHRRLSYGRKLQAERMLAEGMSIEAIADALHVHPWNVRRLVLTQQSPDSRTLPRTRPPLFEREHRPARPIIIVGGRAPWGGWWCPDCPTRCASRAELADHKQTHGSDV